MIGPIRYDEEQLTRWLDGHRGGRCAIGTLQPQVLALTISWIGGGWRRKRVIRIGRLPRACRAGAPHPSLLLLLWRPLDGKTSAIRPGHVAALLFQIQSYWSSMCSINVTFLFWNQTFNVNIVLMSIITLLQLSDNFYMFLERSLVYVLNY